MTGDLVNIGLDAEIEAARHWLSSLGRPEDVSFTPGNHDAYVPAVAAHRRDLRALDHFGGRRRLSLSARRGGVALIGLSSGVPTAPFVASGRLGAEQREKLAALLDKTRAEGLARVVLLHHPPHRGGATMGRGLDDAAEFEAMIARHGAELVLHGHNHKISLHRLTGAHGETMVVGAASASAKAGTHNHRAAYNLYSIAREGDKIVISARSRGIRDDDETIEDLDALAL